MVSEMNFVWVNIFSTLKFWTVGSRGLNGQDLSRGILFTYWRWLLNLQGNFLNFFFFEYRNFLNFPESLSSVKVMFSRKYPSYREKKLKLLFFIL